MNECIKNAYQRTIEKSVRNCEKIGLAFPHVVPKGETAYNKEPIWFWTGGFWSGILHLTYRATGEPHVLALASKLEEKQDENLNDFFLKMHHDVGFLFIPSAVAHYELNQNMESLLRGLKAATILASRFNPKGSFIKAWNHGKEVGGNGETIIDCMMNLSLLYWASKKLDDPRFFHIAAAHAQTVLSYCVRPDGTVPHISIFDAVTGEFIETRAGQGYRSDSCWARGQAWAIYGFAISYRETSDNSFLTAASNIARTYMRRLPKEGIPYWDFDSPEEDRWVFDSSSAAIAASGLLELYQHTEEEWFKESAFTLLTALTARYAIFDDSTEGIISMGTVNYARNKHVNVPIIYGDYFYLEALGKAQGMSGLF